MSVDQDSIIWHVLQLKPNGLRTAKTHLTRQGFQTLMPMRKISQNTRLGLRVVNRPLFPGYLFFAMRTDQINWRAVANTRGVARVITGANSQPAQLPAEIAKGLLAVTAQDGMLTDVTTYVSGDRVAVISGPFAGWLAKVVSADDMGRIHLLVDIMGRTTPIDIAGGDLERRG